MQLCVLSCVLSGSIIGCGLRKSSSLFGRFPLIQHGIHLGDELFLVGHIQHIPRGKDVVGQAAQDVFSSDAVLAGAEDDAGGGLSSGSEMDSSSQ